MKKLTLRKEGQERMSRESGLKTQKEKHGMSKLEFIKKFCEHLTAEQKGMATYHLEKREFLGVVKMTGFSYYSPVFMFCKRAQYLDRGGYWQDVKNKMIWYEDYENES